MKILVFGAGVLGSAYAAWLHRAGHEVSILARGQRLADIQQHGLVIADAASGAQASVPVPAVASFSPDDTYDLVLVVIRQNQLAEALPVLAANKTVPVFLFMMNHASGPAALVEALGVDRVLRAFPMTAGERDGHIIRLRNLEKPALPLGPAVDARTVERPSPHLARVASLFRDAGFDVTIEPNMTDWLVTHAAVVSPIANAIYLAGGDNTRLAETPDGLLLLARAWKEALRVIQRRGYRVNPPVFTLLSWLPEVILLFLVRWVVAQEDFKLAAVHHALAARDEMTALADALRGFATAAELETPALDTLAAYLDPETPPLPSGQAELQVRWTGTLLLAGALLVIGLRVCGPRRSARQRR